MISNISNAVYLRQTPHFPVGVKPKNLSEAEHSQLRLFPSRLDSQLNPYHPLFVLAALVDRDRFDQAYAPLFCPDNGASSSLPDSYPNRAGLFPE